MEPSDLLLWRKKHQMTQQQLASKLGKDRNTVMRWEAGKSRMPVGLWAKLVLLVDTTSATEAPKAICRETADHWPDLELYSKIGHGFGKEHPLMVLGNVELAHLLGVASFYNDWRGPVPASILDHERYLVKLTEQREKTIKSA